MNFCRSGRSPRLPENQQDIKMDSQVLESTTSQENDAAKLTSISSETNEQSALNKKEALVKKTRELVSAVLTAIDEHRSAKSTRESSLVFSKNNLKAFATSEGISVEKFRHSGGVRSLVMAIQTHAESSNVVDFGCQALAALTIHAKATVDDISKANGIESIIKAINAQLGKEHENAQVSAVKVLRNLTQTEISRKNIVASNGLETMISVMNGNRKSPRVLSHSALVLSNLAFGSNEIKESIGTLGGLSAIAKAMTDHHDDQGMQARGSLALRNLLYECERNHNIAGETGVIAALILAIKTFVSDREVVHQSCVALSNVSSISEQNRLKIAADQGSTILVDLMKKYPNSLTVHDDCISIIRNIAVGNGDAQSEVGAAGGIKYICQAIDKFSGEAKFVTKAYACLRYLCFLQQNRELVRESRGIESIINTLKISNNEVGAVENALLAVGNATFDHDENKETVGRCGGIVVLLESVQKHRLNANIQEHGCRVLRNLADGCELNRKLQAEHGGINTAIFAMMGYPEIASIQEQGCAMLLNISQSDATKEPMMKADVPRLAEKAISLHRKHRGVQLQAGCLLDRLNGQNVDRKRETEAPAVERTGSLIQQRRKLKSLFGRGS